MSRKRSISIAAVAVIGLIGVASVPTGCGTDKGDASTPKLDLAALQDPQACKSCHPDHFREWSGSMHAYAAVDPVFLAMNKRAQRETNGAVGSFCVQCHAPLAVRAGLTKDGLNLGELDPKLLGVNCYFCHASEFTGGTFFNNPLTLMEDHVMRGGFDKPVANTAHEATYSTSHDHKNDRSGLFCGTCHDIVNPQGAHIERTFDEWRHSFVAAEDRQNCGFCHMPERTGLAAQAPGVLVRKVHDHSMPGLDLALTPFPEADAQRAGVGKLLEQALSAKLCVTADGATGVNVQVTLRTEKIGHFFPTGAAQDRRAWIQLEAKRGGAVVFSTGQVPEGQSVAAAADPDIFLLRDYHFDAADKETHLFWQTVRVKSGQVPISGYSRAPESDRTLGHAYKFAGAMPDAVDMRLNIRPIDHDLVEELVASGDLAAEIGSRVPTFTLASTSLTWRPGADCVSTPPPPP